MKDTLVSLNTVYSGGERDTGNISDTVASTSSAYVIQYLRGSQHSEFDPSELERTSLSNEQDLSLKPYRDPVFTPAFICNVCKEIFNSKSTLYRHKRKIHQKSEKPGQLFVHPCGICPMKLSSRSAKYRHRRRVHKTGSLNGVVKKCDDDYEPVRSNASYDDDDEQDYMEYNQSSDDGESTTCELVEPKPEPMDDTKIIEPVYESTAAYVSDSQPTSTRQFLEEHGFLNRERSQPSQSREVEEKCQLPLCAAIFCRAANNSKEMQVIWSADLEDDLMRSAGLNSNQCMVIVQDVDTFRDFEKLQGIRKYKPQMIQIPIMEYENKVNIWNLILFGENNAIPSDLRNRVFKTFHEIEEILEEHAKSKEMCFVNMLRYKQEGIFNDLPSQLRGKTVICSFDSPS